MEIWLCTKWRNEKMCKKVQTFKAYGEDIFPAHYQQSYVAWKNN